MSYICWTKMQAEAGQSLQDIISRKERERDKTTGIFLWGVGNPPSRALNDVETEVLPVLFSIMKTQPKLSDVSAEYVYKWTQYEDREGKHHGISKNSLVTSKYAYNKKNHYVLICKSIEPLKLGNKGQFYPKQWVNAGPKKGSIGGQQVTCLLQPSGNIDNSGVYGITMKLELVYPFWVKLIDPVKVKTVDIYGANL